MGFGESGGGEDDLGGVPGDFQELVDAVSLCEVSFEMIEEVSLFLGGRRWSFRSHGDGGGSGGEEGGGEASVSPKLTGDWRLV